MDFVSLAATTNGIHRSLFNRWLESQEDDFSNLAISTSSAASPSLEYRNEQRPLLSPAAEAELFMLATNFLLYVALVIIVVIVAQIYFPESLQRGIATTTATRSIYHTLDEGDDDEEEDLEVEEEEADTVGNGKQQQKKKKPQFSLEFMQGEEDPENMTSKFIALKRLAFCAVVLNVTFVLWGVLQVCSLTSIQTNLF
jgi:cytoskeletal protein RodZ